jgi:hypothetical protein
VPPTRGRPRRAVALALALGALVAACSSADDARPPVRPTTTTGASGQPTEPGTTGPAEPPPTLLLGPAGGGLDAYEAVPPFRSVALVPGDDTGGPDGTAVNGQVCLFPDGTRRFAVGAADAARDPTTTGWAVFQLEGTTVDDLQAEERSRLVPRFTPGPDPPTPAGCGFLSDGRLVTTDVGTRADGAPSGRLTLWLPPYDGEAVASCTLDAAIGTALSLWVDDQDRIYVASARGDAGVWRYSGPYPTTADAGGGCGAADVTGAPLADRTRKERFIAPDDALATPTGVTGDPTGNLYVSSATTGVINRYDANGSFLGTVLQPPAGTTLGPAPLPGGTPLGLAFDPSGALFYADVGLVVPAPGATPTAAPGGGSVRRILLQDGEVGPPETVAGGLDAPDGLGLIVPNPEGGAASRV